MSAEGIGALERGHRQQPYRTTVDVLAQALHLAQDATAELQQAAARAPKPRAGRQTAPAVAMREGHNLPATPTRFFGRECELDELRLLMSRERLVTLTGTGGIGKTRTALLLASEIVEHGEDDVWFVDLARVAGPPGRSEREARNGYTATQPRSEPSLVAAEVARILDVRESARASILETLVGQLKLRSAWLVLDNCEHVIDEAAAVADALLRGCGRLRILATSRERLRITGERVYRLPSLSVPSAETASALNARDAVHYAGVALLCERATAGDSGFVLDTARVPVVADVCRRLDGIPLAIELAAARLNVLTVQALSDRLEARFAVLTGGIRTSLPRQQTMRALIDWSFDLLTAAEQRLFERLSVFAGGFDLAAVTELHADRAQDAEILELLGSLVDKSLVVADVSDGEPRYRLLESTRAYAREKLALRGESELVTLRHAHVFAARAERFERGYWTASDADVERSEADVENWRAALEWTLQARGDIGLGQRIAAALRPIFSRLSYVEGRRWLSAALSSVDDTTPANVRAMLDLGSARISAQLGEWDRCIGESQRAIDAFAALDDDLNAARARRELALAYLFTGRSAEAAALLRAALTVARAHGDSRLTAKVLEELALERSQSHDPQRARPYAREALALWKMLGATENMVGAASVLGEIEFVAGNIEGARQIAAEAVATTRTQAKNRGLAPLLLNLAAYLIAADHWDEARAAAREALGLAQETQRHLWPAFALQHIAAVGVLSGSNDEVPPVCTRLENAARIMGYVDARIAVFNSQREYTERQEYDRTLQVLRALLGHDETARLLAEGAALSHERTIALALST